MSNTLTDEEVQELVELGEQIKGGLSCDLNGTGLPCRSDRLAAVESMIRYLQIHDYEVIDHDEETV